MNIKIKNNVLIKCLLITLGIILMLSISNIISGTINKKFELNEIYLIILKLLLYIGSYIAIIKIFKMHCFRFLNLKCNYKYLVVIGLGTLAMVFENFILDILTPAKIAMLPTGYVYLQKILKIVSNITYPYGVLYLFVLTVIISPIFEELVFRGYILNELYTNTNSRIISSVITSILFGVIHLGIQPGINAFIYSLISCYIMFKFKDIKINITIHSILNLITLITFII